MKQTEEPKKRCEIVYSTDVSELSRYLHKGVCLHLLCLSGEGSFTFNGNIFSFRQNDAIVLSRPDLLEDWQTDEDLQIEYILAPLDFLYNQLPANHYGVGGCISLWDNPVIHLSDADARTLLHDFRRLRDRIGDSNHSFYNEMVGSLALTMIYDLFDFHAKSHRQNEATERKTDLVSQLVSLLSSGRCKQNREVAYYAGLLNVTPKYLSNVVRRQTGISVSALIDRHAVPMLIEYLKNSKLSLSQISDEFHFTSLSYFSRYVQRHLGVSPTEYRKTIQPQKPLSSRKKESATYW
ncbi:helix-turn-helix- domain containing protein AraC type [Bacteroides helcogenes P 36-108]|uniref:Helix-turn-helix-domain containing protein AraC type n=2 Tax=Bacteroides helcogenes TaxID=290053 RepID=E6SRP3_BACT6|nr:helix-turn-helix- domain containing protein AraC type [Bacteroides helcogenes P 36-108]